MWTVRHESVFIWVKLERRTWSFGRRRLNFNTWPPSTSLPTTATSSPRWSPTSSSTSGWPSKSAKPASCTTNSLPDRSCFVLSFHGTNFLTYRSMYLVYLVRYNVSYPALYASESENKNAKSFNCVQVQLLALSFYIHVGNN